MIALILTICCTTSIGVILKLSEGKVSDRLTMLLGNYVVASGISLLLWIKSGDDFSLSETSAMLAPISGFIFALNFFLYSISVTRFGVAFPAILMRLSAIVPILFAIIFLRESGSWVQFAGMAGAMVSAVLISMGVSGGENESRVGNKSWLVILVGIGLLFCFGLADLSMKLFDTYSPAEEKSLFLAVLFGCAGVTIGIWMLLRKTRVTVSDLLWGVMLGIPNMLMSYFLITALGEMSTYIVFPGVSAGSVGMISIVARFWFGERMRWIGVIGIILAVVSLVAVNI